MYDNYKEEWKSVLPWLLVVISTVFVCWLSYMVKDDLILNQKTQVFTSSSRVNGNDVSEEYNTSEGNDMSSGNYVSEESDTFEGNDVSKRKGNNTANKNSPSHRQQNTSIRYEKKHLSFSMDVSDSDIDTFSVVLPPTLPHFKNPCWVETVPANFSYFADSFFYYLSRLFPNDEELIQFGSKFNKMQKIIDARRKKSSENQGLRIRCFPYFFLVGFTKCGTTDFYKSLSFIPDVIPPMIKESAFWYKCRLAHEVQDGVVLRKAKFSDYLDLYDEAAEEISQYTVNFEDNINYHPGVVGDFDPRTIWFYQNWQLIKGNEGRNEPRYLAQHHLYHLYPEAKLLVLMRDPVQRMLSHWRFFSCRMNITLNRNEFHNHVESIIEELEACFKNETVRSCVYNAISARNRIYVMRMAVIGSIYYIFINDWLSVFPREQFFFIKSEDYFENRTSVIMDVVDFLKLNRTVTVDALRNIKEQVIINQSTKTEYLKKTYLLLWNFYRPLNKKLAILLKSKKWDWELHLPREMD